MRILALRLDTQDGASLIEALAALVVIVLVTVAAAGLFQRAGTAMAWSAARGRQVNALYQAATEARSSGSVSSPIEGYPVTLSSRAASWGSDAVLTFRDPNPSCQGDCDPDPASVVSSSSFLTVTVGTVSPQEKSVRVFVIRPNQ